MNKRMQLYFTKTRPRKCRYRHDTFSLNLGFHQGWVYELAWQSATMAVAAILRHVLLPPNAQISIGRMPPM